MNYLIENNTSKRLLSMISNTNLSSEHMVAIANVIGKELEAFKELYADLQLQFYVKTATWGLIYWERRYHLDTDLTLSYEIRRNKILAKKGLNQGVQKNVIERLIESIVGCNVDIIEDVAPFIFEVVFINPSELTDKKWKETLDAIKQAHMKYIYSIRWQSELELETTYTEDAYPLVFCGEIECGTYPEYEDNQTLIDYANADIYQQDFNSDDIYILGGA